MSEGVSVVRSLADLCKVDTALMGILAERKKLEKQIAETELQLKQKCAERDAKVKVLNQKRMTAMREEATLKDEANKLVERRKALGTLSGRKSAEKAEQEITFASHQLEKREEVLLTEMEQNDSLAGDVDRLNGAAKELEAKVTALRQDASETFLNLESREAELRGKREVLARQVDGSNLSLYDRIREKHVDAVTEVLNNACKSCFIQVAPQLVVEISRGAGVVRCRGCGRILFIDESQRALDKADEKKAAQSAKS